MGLVGGILQTAGNFASQSFQRDWNENMYEKQKQFWYEQQDYNSPANQVRRLEEAGLNPQLMLGNIQSGQMGSSPSVPTMSAAQAGSFAGATDSILSIINNKKHQRILDADARFKESDATLNEIDSFTRLTKNLQDISESMSRENKNKVDSFITELLGRADEALKRQQVTESEARTSNEWLKFARGLKELQFLPQQQRLEYLERMEGIANMKANTAESKQRKLKLIQETNHEFFRSQGQKFVNSLNDKTVQYLIDKRQIESYPESTGRIAGGIAREGSKFINEFLGF